MGDAVTTTITVTGMTCAHCARAVRDELSALGGVSTVEVDIASGRVVVQSQAVLAREALRAAVEEAGYVMAP